MERDIGPARIWARRGKALAKVRDVRWANALAAQRVPIADFSFDRTSGELVVSRLGLSLLPRCHEWFLTGYRHALALSQKAGAKFLRDKQSNLVVEVGSIRIGLGRLGPLGA